jgi:16S rRNA (cytosine967-C5)-methyltransferase
MTSPARPAALRAYRLVEEGPTNLPDAIAQMRRALTDARDRALAAEIVTGTLRWRAALDHVIATHATRPLDRIDPVVIAILRLSAYQILFLDRIPARAIVDDAVTMTRAEGKRDATGFVNAVLRKVAAADRDALLPKRPAPLRGGITPQAQATREIEYLSVALSHPAWLVGRWLRRYGFEDTEAWARFDNKGAPLTLRANRLRVTRDQLRDMLAEHDVQVEPARYAPDGLVVRAGHPLQTPLAGQGWFTTQDEASQAVATVAAAAIPEDGERPLAILDACASPGGKTVALAGSVTPNDIVIAADRRPRRIRLLRQTVTAAGATNVRIAQLDLEAALPFTDRFDLVLVDAPCSGLGTIRREPEIRWRRAETDLRAFSSRQRRMLVRAAEAVAPGGRLVYATCSSEPEENEDVAAAFLASHPRFRALDLRTLPQLPSGMTDLIDAMGHLRTYPHQHGLEAFFAAVFERVR